MIKTQQRPNKLTNIQYESENVKSSPAAVFASSLCLPLIFTNEGSNERGGQSGHHHLPYTPPPPDAAMFSSNNSAF